MLEISNQSYAAVLRLKKGEGEALSEIAADVANHLLPIIVVPPLNDLDPGLLVAASPQDSVRHIGQAIGKYWPDRLCLLDTRFLIRKLGMFESEVWLPAMFKAASATRGRAIPVADLKTLEGDTLIGFQCVVRKSTGALALRITAADLERSDLMTRIHDVLRKLVLKPSECLLIMDFGNLAIIEVAAIAEIALANFQRLLEIGIWGQMIWVSTSYPEVNPAKPDQFLTLPRPEWNAWIRAGELDKDFRRLLMFGDYAADSSKFNFGGRVLPHRQYRYSTSNEWVIARGPETGKVEKAMKGVAKKIFESKYFAGVTFSPAERLIYHVFRGISGPGRPSDWRKINIVHHLTRTVVDLGSYRGYEIERRIDERELQEELIL